MFEIVFSGANRSLPNWKMDTGSAMSFSRCSPRSVSGKPSTRSLVVRDSTHLAPVPRRADPSGQVDVVSDVALIRDERRTRVQADTQVDRPRCESVRHRLRRRNGSWDGREGEEEGVSLVVDLDPALGRTRLAHDAPVLGEGVCIRFGTQLVQERRRPLDVGDEERDRPGRKVMSHDAIIRRVGSRVQSRSALGRGSPPARGCGNVA